MMCMKKTYELEELQELNWGREDYVDRLRDLKNLLDPTMPLFLITASDPLFAEIVTEYAQRALLRGECSREVFESVTRHAMAGIEWQKIHGTKTPNIYHSERESVNSELARLTDSTIKHPRSEFSELTKIAGKLGLDVLYLDRDAAIHDDVTSTADINQDWLVNMKSTDIIVYCEGDSYIILDK